MMHRFALGLLIASTCFGQHFTGTFSGWGSVVSPGTGFPPGTRNLSPPSIRSYGGYRNGFGRRSGVGGILVYPSFVGGFPSGYDGFISSEDASVPPPAVAPPAAPPVIINQYFGMPMPQAPPDDDSVHVYSQPSGPYAQQPGQTPQSQNDPQYASSEPTYLIAYKDHSVYSALAYWVEDHTLHYVTTGHTHNQADLSLIDLDFTKKLNQDRNAPFTLNR